MLFQQTLQIPNGANLKYNKPILSRYLTPIKLINQIYKCSELDSPKHFKHHKIIPGSKTSS